MAIDNEALSEWVQWDKGLINPEIFINEEVYREELKQVFGRAWLFLAHDSMIPNAGDFFNTYMGGDPVIVARQRDGSVKAYLNACRHRGMKVCRAEDGNAKTFMCTYHGWAYDIGGQLINVPNEDDAYFNEIDKSKWGLLEVAQIDNYRGLWFATFDSTAPPLLEYLGEMTWYMDSWLDHVPGGIEILPGCIKWVMKANWKMAAEQFAGDGYHAQVTHSSSLGQVGEGMWGNMPPGAQFSSRQGHGHSMVFGRLTRFDDDPLGNYNAERHPVMRERLGDARTNTLGNFTVWPNMSGLPASANLRIWHPKGPNEFEIWSFTVVDKDAPDEVKKAQQLSATLTEGAAGIVEVDDGENWNLIGKILEQGYQTRKMLWNYQMGLGHQTDQHETYPGLVNDTYYGEGPQRTFYRRWLEFMTSEKWPRVDAMREPGEPD